MFYKNKCFSLLQRNISSKPSSLLKKNFTSIHQIHKKKYALIFENLQRNTKIILPDYKAQINLYLEEDITIRKMLEKNKKFLDEEFVYSVSFHEPDGTEISHSCDNEILCRLHSFKIIINGGEKFYHCFNINYLANSDLQEKPVLLENRDWLEIENLMRNNRFSLKEAIVFSEIKSTNQHHLPKSNYFTFSYESIINNFLDNKYNIVEEWMNDKIKKKRLRLAKYLNSFFYLALTQNVFLNMATFIFFSWDVMEPITTVLSYVNLVIGLLFWASTNQDFDIEAFLKWLESKDVTNRNLAKISYAEKYELLDFYNKFKI